MINKAILFFCLAGVSLGLFFQNCSRVPLETTLPGVTIFSIEGSIDICLENTFDKYSLDNLVIANLNLTSSRGVLVVDSDADGIADVDEVALGFDPLKRRTNDKVLDSNCLNVSGSSNCVDQMQACNSSVNLLGLNDCDLKLLRLDTLYGHPDQGLDTDKDGVVDLLEILHGTLPNKYDRNDDPDHDGVMNWLEIQQGTSPIFANTNVDSSHLIEYTTTQVKSTDSEYCGGDLWKVKVKRLPLIETEAYFDPLDSASPLSPTLSHEENENVITVFLKLKARTGSAGNSRIYFKDFKINRLFQGFSFSLEDFKLTGEVLP